MDSRLWETKIPRSKEDLLRLMNFYKIPIHEYGIGSAKSVECLLEEAKTGECVFAIDQAELVRIISVICLYVYQNEKVLREYKQILQDGRERERHLDASVGEKMKQGENPNESLERLLREELPFLVGLPTNGIEIRTEKKESGSYPGLPTIYKKLFYKMTVPKNIVIPLIVKEADGKIVFYKWE
ncbi:MAG TPA: hypothetical protein ENJ75_02835 [Candidatus Kaiserbacteria bacterium]|nr:hypothetical protein [Candidatus Kaiserbacteria bacterium]